jgi:thioredoxin 1
VNPSLPGGANSDTERLAADEWGVDTRLGYTFVPYGRLQQGTRAAPNPNQLGIDVHLATLQALAMLPTGTSVDLQLPFGTLVTRSLDQRQTDTGIGDLEIRIRQALDRFLPPGLPSLGVAIGAVAPTGPYVPHSGAANLPPEASYLTLGRGVPWALAELDVRGGRAEWLAGFAQLAARIPLTRASDEFAWGAELRLAAGARRSLGARWSIVATADAQWRGGATEPDPFGGGRLDSANAGGWMVTASPAASVEVGADIAITAGLRIPVFADVVGNQLVPQLGGFVAVSYAHRFARRAAPGVAEPTATRAIPGEITVVDYWATWCAPCQQVARALDEAAPRWSGVRVVQVDASEWPGPGAPALPAGVAGLPVVEVFDPGGARRALLVGEAALHVVETVDALRAEGAAPSPLHPP